MMPGSGLPSMNLSSMGLINTSTGPASPTKQPEQVSTKPEPAATSTPMSPGAANLSMDSQLAYQQAFLRNAVAQNMQIQQQLMVQNQALTQLLTQGGPASGPSSSMTTMMGTPMPSMMPQQHVVAGT